ncbi:MAG TPA: hypothetical protein P5287_08120, partial [bacterium]|nr:hypothetical protein [bacterium]
MRNDRILRFVISISLVPQLIIAGACGSLVSAETGGCLAPKSAFDQKEKRDRRASPEALRALADALKELESAFENELAMSQTRDIYQNMASLRKIFDLRDDWRTAANWRVFETLPGDMKEIAYRMAGRKAREFIAGKLMIPTRDPFTDKFLGM